MSRRRAGSISASSAARARTEIDDFDAAVARIRELNPPIVLDVHRNPPEGDGGPNHREIWIKDLDGYTVVLASPDGEANSPNDRTP